MGVQLTNRVVMPRPEHPPSPRAPSVLEKIEDYGNYGYVETSTFAISSGRDLYIRPDLF